MGDASAMSSPKESSVPVIYVTGFGPFPPHSINASQKAVELLPTTGLGKNLGVKLVTETIKVEYDYVDSVIPKRWKELNPKLVVHVGVSGMAEVLTLEKLARNNEYERVDICQCTPKLKKCCEGGVDTIISGIAMDHVAHKVNKNLSLKMPCAVSSDAGKYLCEYIYYRSLSEDNSRVAFVHVPTMEKFSANVTAQALSAAIEYMYQQVLEKEGMKPLIDQNQNAQTKECNS